jgi:hypothetical protein
MQRKQSLCDGERRGLWRQDLPSHTYRFLTRSARHVSHNDRHLPFTNIWMFLFSCLWCLHFPKHQFSNQSHMSFLNYVSESQPDKAAKSLARAAPGSQDGDLILNLAKVLWSFPLDKVVAKSLYKVFPDLAFPFSWSLPCTGTLSLFQGKRSKNLC